MAITIASGVGPERGLITAIVGGAFIILVAACVADIGLGGLLTASCSPGFS